MKKLVKTNWLELLEILIVLFDIFFHIIPVIPLVIVCIVVSLCSLDVIGAYVVSVIALPTLLGSTLYLLNITGVASILELLFFLICLYRWKYKKIYQIKNVNNGIQSLLFVLFLLSLSALFSNGGNFAFTKVQETWLNGLFSFFAFSLLLSNPQKCNYIKVGLCLILYSYLLLLLSPLLNKGTGPDNLLDFGYLRAQNLFALEDEKYVIDYQHVGFFATIGCGVILLRTLWENINVKFVFFCVLLCTTASLYSGARQFIIISIVIMGIKLCLQRKNNLGLVNIAVGIIAIFLFVQFLTGDGGALNSVKTEGYLAASNRDLVTYKGLADFVSNPVFGIGYGRFVFGGRFGLYPHNLIVEILCELGIVGFTIIVYKSYIPAIRIFKHYKPCLYLFMILLLRAMVSGGIDSNIMFFSFVFSTSCLMNLVNVKFDKELNSKIA